MLAILITDLRNRVVLSNLKSLARRLVRQIVYSTPIRHYLPRTEATGAQWDKEFQGPTRVYITGTLSTSIREDAALLLMTHHAPKQTEGLRVLDLGCASGNIARRFLQFNRYVGVDISSEAIKYAHSQPALANASFFVSDIQSFNTDEQFDCIVISEVLYYLSVENAEVARYAKMLAPDGIFIVSLKDDPKSHAIGRKIFSSYDFLEGLLFQTKNQPTWSLTRTAERPASLLFAIQPRKTSV